MPTPNTARYHMFILYNSTITPSPARVRRKRNRDGVIEKELGWPNYKGTRDAFQIIQIMQFSSEQKAKST